MSKTFEGVMSRIAEIEFAEEFDTLVAVANGGILPATLLNQRLNLDFQLVKVSLRDSSQKPLYDSPQLVEPLRFDPRGRKILLVEDRVKTGASLEFAKSLLSEAALVKTFCVNGPTDYSLYDETCFRFPWIL